LLLVEAPVPLPVVVGAHCSKLEYVLPSQPTMFEVSVEMKLQFQVTPGQVLVGVCGLLLICGFLYLISREGGSLGG
jgi:hypothetical protein